MSVNSNFDFPVVRVRKNIQVMKEVDRISTTFSFDMILERLRKEFPQIPQDAKIEGCYSSEVPTGVEIYWVEDIENKDSATCAKCQAEECHNYDNEPNVKYNRSGRLIHGENKE